MKKVTYSARDWMNVGIIIGMHEIAKKPITGGFLALKLRDKYLDKLPPKLQKIAKEMVKENK